MEPKEAVDKLISAGLTNTRLIPLGETPDSDIVGGSHIEQAGYVQNVMNGFHIRVLSDHCELAIATPTTVHFTEADYVRVDTLEECVAQVIERVKPQPDYEDYEGALSELTKVLYSFLMVLKTTRRNHVPTQ